MLVFVGEANMATETVLTIDIIQLKVVAKYFHLINHDIEQEKDVSLQFPSSVTLAECTLITAENKSFQSFLYFCCKKRTYFSE